MSPTITLHSYGLLFTQLACHKDCNLQSKNLGARSQESESRRKEIKTEFSKYLAFSPRLRLAVSPRHPGMPGCSGCLLPAACYFSLCPMLYASSHPTSHIPNPAAVLIKQPPPPPPEEPPGCPATLPVTPTSLDTTLSSPSVSTEVTA